jgi:methionyl-tRNA synthetase
MSRRTYITTPIYYPNAKPHLGSLYTTLLADVMRRWALLSGDRVFMMTGTDEHGQKIAETAAKAGKNPQQFLDEIVPSYEALWKRYDIGYDRFLRTTSEDHIRTVEAVLTQLITKGDVYKASYTGWYCTPCESFVTEKDAAAIIEGVPQCPTCGRATKHVAEESYFFKLSAYQDRLLKFYEDFEDFVTPKERLNEVRRFVEGGLKDLSISRTTVSWGIPFPSDPLHTTYVWADALMCYLSAVGYHEGEAGEFWPPTFQLMGKDIVRFHAVYWPAFLMALELPLPQKLMVHGWIKVGEQKMSKSLGNVIDPHTLADTYGVDSVRYYLGRYMAITQDGAFSTADLEERIHSDLADSLGNLLNRVLVLAHKYDAHKVSLAAEYRLLGAPLHELLRATIDGMRHEMANGFVHRAYALLWDFIHQVNAFMHKEEPWRRIKTNRDEFVATIAIVCESLGAIAQLIEPLMPHTAQQIYGALGIVPHTGNALESLAQPWNRSFSLMQVPPLFEKRQPIVEEKDDKKSVASMNYITFEEFQKPVLAVGHITAVETIEKSDKLYKLTVDCGEHGVRTILSGVRKLFTPEELLNTQGVFVLNLPPRPMMGIESQGMMLFVEGANGILTPVVPRNAAKNGSTLR